jgi:hypothetical protein
MLGEQYKSKYTVMARINGGLVIIVKSMNDYLEFSLSAKFMKKPAFTVGFFVSRYCVYWLVEIFVLRL